MSEAIYATGRRKSATARVYLYEGSGNILINDLPLEEYFGREVAKILVKQPLKLLDCDSKCRGFESRYSPVSHFTV